MILADQIKELEQRREALERCLGIDQKRIDLRNEEEKTQEPDFWENVEKAQKIQTRMRQLQKRVEHFHNLEKEREDLSVES